MALPWPICVLYAVLAGTEVDTGLGGGFSGGRADACDATMGGARGGADGCCRPGTATRAGAGALGTLIDVLAWWRAVAVTRAEG